MLFLFGCEFPVDVEPYFCNSLGLDVVDEGGSLTVCTNNKGSIYPFDYTNVLEWYKIQKQNDKEQIAEQWYEFVKIKIGGIENENI